MHFNVESWIWYSFAMGNIVARLISRTLLLGSPLRLQHDDFVMGLFITTCYTVLIVTSNVEIKTRSNLLPPGFDITALTAEEISDRQHGSKVVIVVEQMQIAVIWGCKTCLLILYYRLTGSVAAKSFLALKLLAAYVALGFVVMEALYFAAWCRPFSSYWAVPAPTPQCNALTNHRITNAVFNISSDLIMLSIALSLFIRSMLPLKRKLILCGIFSVGIFAILAAVLNKYYSFTNPYEPDWVFWYVREASTAVLVANLPFTWTLLRRMFGLEAFDAGPVPAQMKYHSSRTSGGRRTARARHAHQGGSLKEMHSNSRGSRGSQPASYLDSIGSRHQGRETSHAPDANVQRHDFVHLSADIDLEQGLAPSLQSPRLHITHQSPSRPTTPLPPSRISLQLSPDGTGGFITRPRHAHLSADYHRPASRASSRATTSRQLMSPTPSHIGSVVSDRGSHAEPGCGGADGESGKVAGARSAVDRRKRGRLSA
ncbi:uncharacterized protein EI97DRAFT_380272 [Westerdykella ornata]|uniref:Rhodopsin domain-containing protein n=1 Tax=Westerdykella ornata TaxID=318751 RepID=A0A6A6JEK2_WESOR|nr:uncharacterized protein EI97DRAFT_380272 [Westerdykella ornata]KAF2274991.1 hypothetical protein EI97DRAFT_380272 [Westerdykella ornata]